MKVGQNNLKTSPYDIKLQKLREQEEAIAEEKEKIYQEQEIAQAVKRQLAVVQKEKNETIKHNKFIEDLVNKCRKEGIDEKYVWIEIKNKTIQATHSFTDIIPEEQKLSIQVEQKLLKTKWGTPYINEDGIEQSSITGRYQYYKPNSWVNKVIQHINKVKEKEEIKNDYENVKNSLTNEFLNKYPKGTTVEYSTESEWVTPHKRDELRKIHFLTIHFPNGSWVKVRFYDSGNWYISKKYDANYPRFKEKEEWLDYLSK